MVLLLDEEVHLCAYDERWPHWFSIEAARLAEALPAGTAIEHIDIMMNAPVVDVGKGLLSSGYEDLGEAGVPGRWYFRRRSEYGFNVHLIGRESAMWKANIALRDYLRASPEAGEEYAAAKQIAVHQGSGRLLAYSTAKAAILQKLVAQALEVR
jgi:GrpB-like predicted nucleotidyltransferase (UPF0157 family)